jgi:hypothetical protein
MSMFDSILTKIGAAAGELATRFIPGAGAIPELISAGKALSEAFVSLKAHNGGTAPAAAEAGHSALYAAVSRHAESTFGRLEGG